MAVLAMLELDGDTEQLLAASEALDGLLGPPEGLIARIVAPTETGMVLFQLWESSEARQRNANNPGHGAALAASGMTSLVTGSRSRVYDAASLQLFSTRPEDS